ncbi:hypothetical protein CS0771_45420 [Catellatospora sp. IY07-71]|uniref:hypothetical protein n=1 Tax=Catellatospora sp. IY07-71 TaxID=2728827 RepID=UPI001BB3BC1A|nr:hypothetical protein [Catellatospora sp. IY07-71]BCJ74998.1 hypothetical protein CS0771_45420 [Catellatospora sp. IY07-71]
MHRTELDGVTVSWQDVSEDVHASLVFGVGTRDEGVDRIGLNHLVQLLVLDEISSEADQHTTFVDTAFTASGTPGEVAAHLAECCAVLADLPLDRLDEIAAQADPGDLVVSLGLELGDSCRDPWGSLLARRLGTAGAGVARWPAVPYAAFTADEVRAHAARFFHAGNAALGLSRAPWPGLEIPLPPGPRPDHDAVAARTAGWYHDEVVAPGIAVTAAAGPLAMLVLGVLRIRVNDALDEAGFDCWTNEWSTPVSASTLEIGLGVHYSGKGRTRDSALAAAILWEQLRGIATTPPTPDELDEAIDWMAAEDGIGLLPIEAKASLLSPSDEFGADDIAAARGLTPHDVSGAAASWLGSALVVVPTGTEVDLAGLARIGCPVGTFAPQGKVLKPSLWRKLRRGDDEHLVLADDAIHHVRDGAVHSTPFSDAILVEHGTEVLLGNVRHGCLTDVTAFGAAKTIGVRLPDRRWRITR